jgi:hypothetical protein
MPTSEAQRRASNKWNMNNADKIKEMRKIWIENNRERINEQTRIRQKMYYDQKNYNNPDTEFKNFRRILLNLY